MSRNPYTTFLHGTVAATCAQHASRRFGSVPWLTHLLRHGGLRNNADGGCVAAVQGFIDGWILQLHQSGDAGVTIHIDTNALDALIAG
jgi:hypothetical protein